MLAVSGLSVFLSHNVNYVNFAKADEEKRAHLLVWTPCGPSFSASGTNQQPDAGDVRFFGQKPVRTPLVATDLPAPAQSYRPVRVRWLGSLAQAHAWPPTRVSAPR